MGAGTGNFFAGLVQGLGGQLDKWADQAQRKEQQEAEKQFKEQLLQLRKDEHEWDKKESAAKTAREKEAIQWARKQDQFNRYMGLAEITTDETQRKKFIAMALGSSGMGDSDIRELLGLPGAGGGDLPDDPRSLKLKAAHKTQEEIRREGFGGTLVEAFGDLLFGAREKAKGYFREDIPSLPAHEVTQPPKDLLSAQAEGNYNAQVGIPSAPAHSPFRYGGDVEMIEKSNAVLDLLKWIDSDPVRRNITDPGFKWLDSDPVRRNITSKDPVRDYLTKLLGRIAAEAPSKIDDLRYALGRREPKNEPRGKFIEEIIAEGLRNTIPKNFGVASGLSGQGSIIDPLKGHAQESSGLVELLSNTGRFLRGGSIADTIPPQGGEDQEKGLRSLANKFSTESPLNANQVYEILIMIKENEFDLSRFIPGIPKDQAKGSSK